MTNESKNYFKEIEKCAAFSRVRALLVTHPKKAGKFARILCACPKDGAGRLTVYIVDSFGESTTTMKGTAGGYGYDKLTAALSNLTIDGHDLSDHCQLTAQSAKFLKDYGKAAKLGCEARKAVETKARKAGYSFANWASGDVYDGWQSCYRESGLDYLRALGYSIITVI